MTGNPKLEPEHQPEQQLFTHFEEGELVESPRDEQDGAALGRLLKVKNEEVEKPKRGELVRVLEAAKELYSQLYQHQEHASAREVLDLITDLEKLLQKYERLNSIGFTNTAKISGALAILSVSITFSIFKLLSHGAEYDQLGAAAVFNATLIVTEALNKLPFDLAKKIPSLSSLSEPLYRRLVNARLENKIQAKVVKLKEYTD